MSTERQQASAEFTVTLTARIRPDGITAIRSPDMPGFSYLLPAGEGLGEAIMMFRNLLAQGRVSNAIH